MPQDFEHGEGGGGKGDTGFYCADLTLRYPYHKCTITVTILLVCMLLLPMVFIGVVEIMRQCRNFKMRSYIKSLACSEIVFSCGFIATFLTTELAKNVVGRLRPHFYEACQPLLLDGSSCENLAAGMFVSQYYCSNRNLSSTELRELQVSFPSAHASLSFYSMLFLGFYLHEVWHTRNAFVHMIKHIIQFLMLLSAWYFALSRVVDHWHHWSDVLAGGIMGITYALLNYFYAGRKYLKSPPTSSLHSSHKDILVSSANNTHATTVAPLRKSSICE